MDSAFSIREEFLESPLERAMQIVTDVGGFLLKGPHLLTLGVR